MFTQFYDEEQDSFILNQVYELIGVVSLTPMIAAFEEDKEEESSLEDCRGAQQRLPASVVPRSALQQ